MIIGVPTEIKTEEYRVGMTPESVAVAKKHGHKIFVQSGAGNGIGKLDVDYENAGAKILKTAKEVFTKSEMIVKVKEPQQIECEMLKKGQILYTYLHLAPDPLQTESLVKSGAVCIAYETITSDNGELPMLKPMSQVAGRLAIQAGARAMEKHAGGNGILLGGTPGVAPANVLIIGGGVVGLNAAQMAVGMRANTTILDTNQNTIENLDNYFDGKARVLSSNAEVLASELKHADLVIGGVLVAGAKAPHIITRNMLKTMKKDSVLVDVAIDQGGCFETSKPTTHNNPSYVVDDIIHYCVANMPGAVPKTSAYALNNATLGGLLNIADKGWKQALKDDKHLLNGLNVCNGKITYKVVADVLGYEYVNPESFFDL
jgi:alanine dehydrogenase